MVYKQMKIYKDIQNKKLKIFSGNKLLKSTFIINGTQYDISQKISYDKDKELLEKDFQKNQKCLLCEILKNCRKIIAKVMEWSITVFVLQLN